MPGEAEADRLRALASPRPSKLAFFKTFLSNPTQIGAILPSGDALARAITAPIDYASAAVIVEFGPGTGSFTEVLLRNKRPETRLLAFEVNETMADWVAESMPEVELVRDGAQNLLKHLEERGIDKVDAVVSGLPFANFPPALRDAILEGARAALKPGGLFLSFTYYHSGIVPTTHRYKARLGNLFQKVDKIPVMRNAPPAYVLRCKAG